ncbi:MAG: DUF2130 domain-containing protein [Candidatus Levybacteria bacterium]|nr:DUF2130 domain-containing protein [Candidatus Levybacteria bacterium]
MNTIICPNCKKPVEISSAISEQIEQEVIEREHEKHQLELDAARKKATDESAKKIQEQFELQLKHAEEENEAAAKRNKDLIEQITQLTKDMRELRREKEEVKLTMEKQLAVEEEKIRQEAQKKAEEEQHTKIAEKDKKLTDALKEIEEMRRKLQQGSQQTQGEAFELEFETLLHQEFPNDKVSPVGKGIRGGDIVQEVWDSKGNYNGKILWELKNTKTWSEGWVDKLKSDKRAIHAEEAVIISEILPPNMRTAGYRNGVWVTKREFVITLAATLRAKLIEMYYVKQSVQAKDGKMELMYTYLSGTEFKHRVEAIVEAFTNMQAETEKEKRYFMNKWARDEKNVRMVIDNTYGMHGDLKAIIGKMLPQIKGLDAIDYDIKDAQLQLSEGEKSNGKADVS